MRRAALISQTLRADHCVAYVTHHPGDWTILTSDPKAILRAGDLPPGVEVAVASPPPHILPPSELNRNRRYRSVITWARSGSKAGQWVEAFAHWVRRQVRSVSRGTSVADPQPDATDGDVRDSDTYKQLVDRHLRTPLRQIVVFDVFDLPVAMALADDYNVAVLVR